MICVAPWVEMRKVIADEAEYGAMIIYDPRAADKGAGNRFNNQRMAAGGEEDGLQATLSGG